MEVDIHGAPVYFEIPILGGIPITASTEERIRELGRR